MADAVILSLAFASTFGKLHPEANALCAHILVQTGNNAAALDFWDKAINQCPDHMAWMGQALQTAWATGDEVRAGQYVDILKHVFCTHPSPKLLDELAQHGSILSGACGIHAGHFRAWLWLPQGKTFSIKSAPAKPALQPGSLTKNAACDHTLYELDVPLTAHCAPYCISLTVDGRHVSGSPAFCSPCDAARPVKKGTPRNKRSAQQEVTIVIPCYDGYAETLSCLGSVFASLKRNTTKTTILTMWDHGPDAKLYAALSRLSVRHKIRMESTPANMGFLGSVNQALTQISEGDVILLNADTLVHGDWIDRMVKVAQLSDAGTVTAMGSDAELVSFPAYYDRGDVRTLREAAMLDNACCSLPPEMHVQEIPVGVGFCMLMTRRALNKLVGLDGLMLFRGYGEETDFCLRASEQKFKNYAVCNVYVAHLGGRSFGASKRAYVAQNNKAIFHKFPSYDKSYDLFLLEDKLRETRDHISRHACQPKNCSLHVYPWVAQYAAPLDSTEKSMAAHAAECFVRPSGSAMKVLVRIVQKIALADMVFLLPKDTLALGAFVQKCGFKDLIVHGHYRWIPRLEKCLGLDAHLAEMGEKSMPFDITNQKSTYLVIPPVTMYGWKCFFDYAYSHPLATFFVQHLKQVWGLSPHPENVCALPDIQNFSPLHPTAMLFAERQEADRVIACHSWLKEHAVPDLSIGMIPAEAA